jgi:hypothetical protein
MGERPASRVDRRSQARRIGLGHRAAFTSTFAGNRGLVRRTGNDHGAKVGYVDTTRLARQLDLAIAKLSEPMADGGAEPIQPIGAILPSSKKYVLH